MPSPCSAPMPPSRYRYSTPGSRMAYGTDMPAASKPMNNTKIKTIRYSPPMASSGSGDEARSARQRAQPPHIGGQHAQQCPCQGQHAQRHRSEEHTSELQSLMRNSYAVFCLKQKNQDEHQHHKYTYHIS